MYCDCGGKLIHYTTVERNEQYWVFYYCSLPECGKPTHRIQYKYSPSLCPKHRWEHMGTEFVDDPNQHKINYVRRCFMCGTVIRLPMDTQGAGIRGRVEIEHPHIQKQLLWNQSAYERLIPRELREMSAGKLPKEALLPTEENT